MITFEEFKEKVEWKDEEYDMDVDTLAGLIEREIDRKIETMMHKGKQRICVTHIEELENGTKYYAAFDSIIGYALVEVEKRYREAGWEVDVGDSRLREQNKERFGKYFICVDIPRGG